MLTGLMLGVGVAGAAGGLVGTSRAGAVADGLQLIMIEEEGCGYCARWRKEVEPGYAASDEGMMAPLVRVDRFSPQAGSFERIVFTPTFLLVRDGRERGRITGYPGADFFWSLLAELLHKEAAAR